MRRLTYRIETEHRGTALDLFYRGLSFQLCVESGCWPPLATMNDFLQCGYDDLPAEAVLLWRPFALDAREYRSIQQHFREQGHSARIRRFGLKAPAYSPWFLELVGRLRLDPKGRFDRRAKENRRAKTARR